MPDLYMDVDTALAEVPVNLMPLIDDGDFKTIEGSVAYDAAGMALRWHFVTTAGAYTVTSVTPTTGGNYDWTDQGDSGVYTIEIPASGGASINNDTEGFGWFTGVATGVLPWRGPVICFRAAALNNADIDGGDTRDVNVTEWLGTAAATPTVAGVPEVDVTHVAGSAQTITTFIAKFAGITLVRHWLQLFARKDNAITADAVTALGEINADEGSGVGGFANATDSLEGNLDSNPLNHSIMVIDGNGRVDVSKIEGTDATDQIRDAVVDDNTRIDASALNTATGTTIPAIVADTNELQTDWVDGGRLDLILDARASQTSVDAVDDLIDTEVAAIKTDTAAILLHPTRTVVRGTVGTATTPSTTQFTPSALSPSGVAADQFKGRILVWDNDTTTTALRGQATDITASSAASLPLFTFTAVTTAPASGDTFSIV